MKPLKTALALACASALAPPVAAAAPAAANATVVQQLESRIDDMASQLAAMKAQLKALQDQNAALATQQQTQARQQADQGVQVQQLQASQETIQQAAAKPSVFDGLSIYGYGEMAYSRPSNRPKQSTADLSRAVFGFGYQFNASTRFASEFEVEHAVTSASDAGEFEVEQFYVDHTFNDYLSAKAGLFLMPFGLLNENHEPTNYYGVYRNFVETLIIPSTWREGGLALHGNASGLDWSAGLTTGMNLSAWGFTPETPPYTSALELQNNGTAPLQATHQELSFAHADGAAGYLSLNYRGVPGLQVGGALFMGDATPVAGVASQQVTLWETHGRWTPGKWDLSALYARGSISHAGAANALYPGASNPMPSEFYGWYLQGAYNLWQQGDYRLAPFVRYERYNMGAKYEGIAPGFSPVPAGAVDASGIPFANPFDTVWTVGLNFYITPNIVLKTDYQWFRENPGFNRFDLGLGLYF